MIEIDVIALRQKHQAELAQFEAQLAMVEYQERRILAQKELVLQAINERRGILGLLDSLNHTVEVS